MVNAQFSKHVASMETREGCPITPGASFTKQFYLVPLASSNKDRQGKIDIYLFKYYLIPNIEMFYFIVYNRHCSRRPFKR